MLHFFGQQSFVLKLKKDMLNYIYFFLLCVEIMAIEWHGKFCKEEDDFSFIHFSKKFGK